MSTPPPATARFRVFHAGGMAAAERHVGRSDVPGTRYAAWYPSVRLPDGGERIGPPLGTLDEALSWGLSHLWPAPVQ